jgi:hypothetical protein
VAAADGTPAADAALNFRTGLMSPRPGVFGFAENGNQRVIEIR